MKQSTAQKIAQKLGISVKDAETLQKNGNLDNLHYESRDEEHIVINTPNETKLVKETAEVNIELEREVISSIKFIKKTALIIGVCIAVYLFLVIVFTLLYIFKPTETANLLGLTKNHKSAILAKVNEHANVLGAQTSAGEEFQTRTFSPLQTMLIPIASVSLNVVKAVSPQSYTEIAKTTIVDVNDIVGIDSDGSLTPIRPLSIANSSMLQIESDEVVPNLNSSLLQGRKPGNKPGDLAVVGADSTESNAPPGDDDDTVIFGLTNDNLSGNAGITNTNLANDSITINTTGPLSGGGSVSLGGVLTLACPTCVDGTGFLTAGSTDTLSNKTIAAGSNTITGLTNGNLSGNAGITDSNLAVISSSGKVLGSAVQLNSGGGLINNSGISLLTSCSDGQVLAWDASSSSWNCSTSAGGGGGGDITNVIAGSGLSGGGATGDVTLTVNPQTGGGLSVSASGVSLMQSCADNQILKWNDGLSQWECAADAGGSAGISTIQEDDATVVAAPTVLDFLGSDFALTDSPSGEGNIAIDYLNSGITRRAQNETISGNWTFSSATPIAFTNTNPTVAIGNTGTFAITDGTNTLFSIADNGANGILTTTGGLTVSSGTVSLPAGQIDNTELANSSLTITAGNGLTGGGVISLGGSVSLASALGTDITNLEIAADTIDFSAVSDALTLDAATIITAGSALNLTIGNNVSLISSGTGSITANALSAGTYGISISGNAATVTNGVYTNTSFGGDVSGTAGNLLVSDDSHNHTSSTISGLDISDDTNLSASNGIALTGDALTNTDRGSDQNIFKSFAVSGQTSVAPDSNTDTMTLVAGTNVLITTDAANDTITINTTDSNTTYSAGSDLDLTGTTFALESILDSVETINLSGTGTLNGLDAVDATSETTIEGAIDMLGNLTSATSLVSVGTLTSGATGTGFTLNFTNSTLSGNITGTNIDESTLAGLTTSNFTSSAVSQWSNDAGYITDGNTNWNNSYGLITASSTDTLTNKSGNISQWTNNAGYLTGNQTITLSGAVSGSGTTTITTSLEDNAVTADAIADDAITFAKVGQNSCADNQVIKWNSTAWACADDATGATGNYVTLNPSAADNASGTNPGLWVNHGGSGALLRLQNGGGTAVDRFVVSNAGIITTGGYQATAIEDTYVSDTLTISASGSVAASALTGTINTARIVGLGASNFTSSGVSQWTNDAGYIADGNTNWDNSYGFTTASSTATLTNKSGNISQWTNDTGYITDGNTNWDNAYGLITASSTDTLTNKSGNISQWTNNSGYLSSVDISSNTNLSASDGITLTGDALSNSDKGSSQNIFKTVAVSGQSNVVSDTNSDALTFIAGTNITLTTDATNDSVTINATDTNTTYLAGNDLDLNGTTFDLESTIDTVGTINLSGTGTINGLDAIDGTTESTIESSIDTLANLTSASSLATVGTLTSGSTGTGFTLNFTNSTLSGNITGTNIDESSLSGLAASNFTSANVSQWSNDAGYITDGNTNWNNSYGYITAASTDTLTNKSGNISQWANDSGYLTTVDVSTNTNLSASDGIALTGDALTNTDKGSAQNIFKTFAVSGQSSVVSDANSDTMTLVGGSNITITTDASSDTITIAAAAGSSYSAGNDLDLNGTTFDLESTLDTVGTINLAGTGTLNGLDAIDATTESTIEGAIDTLGNLTSATSLVSVGTLTSGATGTGFTLNFTNSTLSGNVTGTNIDESTLAGLTTSNFTSANISQWTNNAGYITDGNTGWDNSYGYITAASSDTLTNKSGNISQWSNDSGYITSVDVSANTNLTATNGITLTGDQLTLSSTTGGDGLTYTTGVLAVGAGTGISVAADSISATLGTSIANTEIDNDAIDLDKVSDTLVFDANLTLNSNNATNDYKMIMDNSSTGDIAELFEVTTSGTGATIGTALDLSDADISVALALGANDITVAGITLASSELARLDGKDAGLVDTNDAVGTAITGTGTLTSGATGTGFTLNFGTSTLSGDITGSNISGIDISNDTNLSASDGISLTGDALTNTDKGSSQNIFKTIAVSGQSDVVSDLNSDTLTLAAGTNVTITTTAGSDTITINATDTNTTYTAGTDLDLTGTTFSLETTLDSVDTINLAGTGTLNGLDALDATSESTIEGAIDTLANLSSITIGGDTLTELVGSGLVLSSNTLTASLGTNITPGELDSQGTATDELCLTSETTSGAPFEWQACGSGGGLSTIRESDGGPSIGSATTIEFGPGTTSSDEFIVSDQTGGVVRVQIGNQVAMLNQNETVTGNWAFSGTIDANGQVDLGDNGDTVSIDSNDWDISTTGALTGLSFDANGTGNSISNIESADILNGTLAAADLDFATEDGAAADGECLKFETSGGGDFKWDPCGSGSQTPWVADIDADGFDLADVSNILFRETTGAPAGTDVGLHRDNAGDLNANVLTGKSFNVQINGTDEFNFSSSGLTVGDNDIVTAGATIASTELDRLDGKDAALVDQNDLTAADGAGGTSSGSGLEAGTGGIGLLQGCGDQQTLEWTESSSTWGCATAGDAKAETFTANGTYTKPSDAIIVIVEGIGSGGGGAGGEGGTTAAIRSGGGGGGGGTFVTDSFAAADLGATVSITVPAGGTGGASSALDGSAGTSASFGTHLVAYGGGAGGVAVGVGGGGGGGAGIGAVGTSSTNQTGATGGGPTGGAAGASIAGASGGGGGTAAATGGTGGSSTTGGGGGGASSSTGAGNGGTGGSSLKGGAGGGGGASCPITTFVARNGGAAGNSNSGVNGGGPAGGVGNATAGTSGTGGTAGFSGNGGSGGGGGGNSGNGTGGAGGAGGIPGGGGGGGACGQATTGGAGGTGGRGEIRVWTIKGSGADLAEIYGTTDESIEAGDVVSLDPNLRAGVKKSGAAYDKTVMGIISTSPGMVIGSLEDEGTAPVMVALSGRVPVKVSTENGPIKAGDLLTSSRTPGVAMKATKAGQVIGQAMTAYDSPEVGKVLVFVKTDFSQGSGLAEMVASISPEESPEGQDIGRLVLSKLVDEKEQLVQSVDLSEIVTDRVAAGIEIITPRIVADEIVARSIKADRIEGLEFIQTGLTEQDSRLSTLETMFATSSARQNSIVSLTATDSGKVTMTETNSLSLKSLEVDGLVTISGQVTAEKLRVKDSLLVEAVTNIADTLTSASLIVNDLATFFGKAVFKDDVSIDGKIIAGQDTAGTAIVKKGADRVEITFGSAYDEKPIVNASFSFDEGQDDLETTFLQSDIKYIISKTSTKGFIIKLNKPATQDVQFNWTAVGKSQSTKIQQSSSTAVVTPKEELIQVSGVPITATPTPLQD